ncbi:Mov34/MPN/PAD-1 family protein [Treponema endosymbiont of Eucomonympha sp.]|uniref:Mov34/MPN/PAD-1 family protein n=1 Tax=Treponema endosymbiont of Eucomonympha sp. TaxID=1580831 RepID=UPI000750888C|nr:M67 family metallopeptidase [Treponema endosymbiont of Eucomonympha sp.]
MICLPAECEAYIKQAGEAAYPNECCGILVGTVRGIGVKAVDRLVPVRNAFGAEEQYHRFQIEADDLFKAEQESRKLRKEVVGFYHSHPDHAASPSDFDRTRAFPFYSYIIVAVGKGQANDMTSWELAADWSRFEPEEIERAPEDSRG